jgi:hypothetical protein
MHKRQQYLSTLNAPSPYNKQHNAFQAAGNIWHVIFKETLKLLTIRSIQTDCILRGYGDPEVHSEPQVNTRRP